MVGFKKSHPLQGEINKYILAGGFRQPTQLQEKLIPLLLSGKDAVVEAGEQRGKSLAMAIALILKIKKTHQGTKALVVTESADTEAKLAGGIKRLAQLKANKLDVITVGFSDLIKKEGRQLSSNPDIIIGTAARIIDHIRRGHVDFAHVEMVFIDESREKKQEFINDIYFIFSKIPGQKQVIYFSNSLDANENNILSLLKRPGMLEKSDFLQDNLSLKHSYLVTENKIEALKALLLARRMDAVLILCATLPDCGKVEKELNNTQLRASFITRSLPEDKFNRILDTFNTGKKAILIAGIPEIKSIGPEGISSVIFYDLPVKPEEYSEISKPAAIGSNCRQIINLVSEVQVKEIAKIEEICNMKMQQQEIPDDKEVIKGFLANIIKKIKEEESPDELDYYRKLIKKSVSLFDRSYLAAYFIRNTFKKATPKKSNLTTLFISIGKTRRVFHQDLVKLFTDALQINAAEIGDIKILENYSFVDIPTQYCQKAIEALNNFDFKGRKLTVNYSRKRMERKPVGARRPKQFH